MLGVVMKKSAAVLDYDIDISRWLPDGDTITSAIADVQPAASMVTVPRVDVQPDLVKVWTADGVSGMTATVTVTITTAQGRKDPFEFQIRVRD